MKTLLRTALIGTAAAFISAAPAVADATEYPACGPDPEYSSTSVVEYLQQRSGVEQNTVATSRRGYACSEAMSKAESSARYNCSLSGWSTGSCFNCFNDGDRDDPEWFCSVRWSCER